MNLLQKCGQPTPIGATVLPTGTNFCLYSREATGVDLLFFDLDNDSKPSRIVTIDPIINRTYHYWHTFVPGIRAGQIYGYRVHGPLIRQVGFASIQQRYCLTLMAAVLSFPSATTAKRPLSPRTANIASAMKSVVVDPRSYDWEGDIPLTHSLYAHDHLRIACEGIHAASRAPRFRKIFVAHFEV